MEVLYVHVESLHTADDAERQTMCEVHHVHIQSVCVCLCARACSDCGMCSHSQTNNGSLPASMVRERIGLRGSERMLVYRGQPFGMVCPPLVTLVIAAFLAHLHMIVFDSEANK